MDYPVPSNRGASAANGHGRTASHIPVDTQPDRRAQRKWEPPPGEIHAQSAPVQQFKKHPAPSPTRERVDGPPVRHNVDVPDAVGEKRSENKPIPRDFPPVVYLPCAEAVNDPNDARIDMRET